MVDHRIGNENCFLRAILKKQIQGHLKGEGNEITLKNIVPSYVIRWSGCHVDLPISIVTLR